MLIRCRSDHITSIASFSQMIQSFVLPCCVLRHISLFRWNFIRDRLLLAIASFWSSWSSASRLLLWLWFAWIFLRFKDKILFCILGVISHLSFRVILLRSLGMFPFVVVACHVHGILATDVRLTPSLMSILIVAHLSLILLQCARDGWMYMQFLLTFR